MTKPWALFLVASLVASADTPVEFERDVLPILQKHCHACHGPETQKSGYRLDLRDTALRGGDSGKPSIVPHDAQASPLIRFVSGADPEMLMPPRKSGQSGLNASEVETLKHWINAGPAWPEALAGNSEESTLLWSLTPLQPLPVPPGRIHPIDAFIVATLAEKGLEPAPAADRITLLRRLSYDLTGLPPTEDERTAFVSDDRPNAYDTLVTRLLDSPRHGEHWARHWLDIANYADTHGNDHDYARPNAWPYRDYVIRSFNSDKPYTQFVLEQVAGDALFPDDPDATVALGFLAAGPWDHTLMVTVREDTVDHRMAQNLDRDSMVSAAVGTFQSLTIHCARCHNHKFDPISQREYYTLQAVFAGVDRADRPFDPESRTHATRQRLLAERRLIDTRHPALLARLESSEVIRTVQSWEEAWQHREQAWSALDILSVISNGGATLTRETDGSWFASGKRPDRDTYIVTARRKAGTLRAVRLEVLPDDRLPQRGPGRWDNGNFHLSEFRAFASTNGTQESGTPIVFARAAADYNEGPAISAAQAIDGKNETQWGVHPRYGQPHEAVFEPKDPPASPDGTILTLLLEHQDGAPGHGIGRFRLSTTDRDPAGSILQPLAVELTAILRTPLAERTPAQRQDLALAVLKSNLQRALAGLPEPHHVYAVTRDFPPDGPNFKPSPQPRAIHVLARGDLAKPGDLVGPGTLGCVPGLPGELTLSATEAEDESLRRAALARWLVDERNVLTWRSIVNRVWSYHFGRGLCDTPNDFGRMGGTPSHPALLDWLAVWFRDDAKGSLKALHRLIVTSDTWQQSSRAKQVPEFDSDNRLLWRQNRPRLTAEQVRDTVLSLGDRLDTSMGGTSAVQFNSRGDATFNAGGNPPYLDYEHFDPDAAAARRRAVYRFVFRTVPDPFMDALDCPDGAAVTPVRSVSTTALQAFALLNNPFLIRQSEHIAARIAAQASQPEAQANTAFQRILLRDARAPERVRFAAYIERHGLANATQLLLNSNEFLHLD